MRQVWIEVKHVGRKDIFDKLVEFWFIKYDEGYGMSMEVIRPSFSTPDTVH